MATLLHLLWDLVERPDERTEYLHDPAGYVRAHGRAGLTAEDVHAALDVVCDLVPADLAAVIEAGKPAAPALSLASDETPLDRGLLLLSHIVESLDGQPEADPRPDPKDTAIDPAEVAADAAPLGGIAPSDEISPSDEEASSAEPAHMTFDPSALEIDDDPLRSHEVTEPAMAAHDELPFDPTSILLADDGESDMADVVPLLRDDPAAPEFAETATTESPGDHGTVEERVLAAEPPAATLVPEGGFGTGGLDVAADDGDPTPRDDDDTDDTEDEVAEATIGRTNLFTKKPGVVLPTLGIDASDWYDEDEPE